MGERSEFRRLEALANLLMFMTVFLGGVFAGIYIDDARKPACKDSLHTEMRSEEIGINRNAIKSLIPKTASEEITPSDHIGGVTEMVPDLANLTKAPE